MDQRGGDGWEGEGASEEASTQPSEAGRDRVPDEREPGTDVAFESLGAYGSLPGEPPGDGNAPDLTSDGGTEPGTPDTNDQGFGPSEPTSMPDLNDRTPF